MDPWGLSPLTPDELNRYKAAHANPVRTLVRSARERVDAATRTVAAAAVGMVKTAAKAADTVWKAGSLMVEYSAHQVVERAKDVSSGHRG